MNTSRRGLLGGIAVVAALPAAAAAQVPFGAHQPGIATPGQDHTYFAAFDVASGKRADLAALLRTWTDAARTLMAGAETPGDSLEAAGYAPRG